MPDESAGVFSHGDFISASRHGADIHEMNGS